MALTEALDEASEAVALELAAIRAGRERFQLLREPERCKYLHRLHDALADLSRFDQTRFADPTYVISVLERVGPAATRGSSDDLWAVLNEIQLVRIRAGDGEVVCGMIETELGWHKGQASWLTWDSLYPKDKEPDAVLRYRKGEALSDDDLAGARNQLLSLFRARHDDEVSHRARADERAKNLQLLSILLATLLAAFVLFYSFRHDWTDWEQFGILITAGAVGAAISGTIKARDRLTRQADIRRFRDALAAQLLVGASTAVFVYFILASDVVEFGSVDFDTDEAQAVVGFLAGFSEPWVLRTIERASKLGSIVE